jgi:hypothetical protein
MRYFPLFVLLFGISVCRAEKTKKEKEKVVYTLDFAKATGAPEEWLKKKGFRFEKDADDIKLKFSDKSLILTTEEPLLGVIINDKLDLKEYSKIRITWGIKDYPLGACYEKGVNNEAVMIYVFLGNEKLPSGSFFIPKSPYFLALFLGEKDIPGKAYIGRHFKQGGRFICVGAPKEGETVVTEFDLPKAYKEHFKKNDKLPITGLSLEVDTSYLDEGKGSAFIKKIEILK